MNATETSTNTTSQPKRRWFCYSLRTLLLIITALCIWLGRQVEAARKQHDAVAAILAIDGGEVWYDFQEPAYPFEEKPEPHFAAKLLGLDLFYNVTIVSISDDSARLIPQVAKLSHLRRLLIYRCNLRDEDVEHLANLKQLEFLLLCDNQITGTGLTFLEGMRGLQDLYLSGNPIVDGNLGFLRSVSHVKELDLGGSELTDASIPQLAKVPQSMKLDISGTNITSDGVWRLLELRPDPEGPFGSLVYSSPDPKPGPFRSHLSRNNPIHRRKILLRFRNWHH